MSISSSRCFRHFTTYPIHLAAALKAPKAPKAKTNSIRVQTAYKPIFPGYINRAPKWRTGKPPSILPFFKEKSHTIPTKWSLYRSLLRATYGGSPCSPAKHPSDVNRSIEETTNITTLPGEISGVQGFPNLRRKIQLNWKKHRPQTSMSITRAFLSTQYTLLSTLLSPSPTDLSLLSTTESRLSRQFARIDRAAERRANRPKPRYRLTGGFIYPSIHNPPLPRMKPQPPHFSGMIRSRIIARNRRMAIMREQQEWTRDVIAEDEFLKGCGVEVGKTDGGWMGALRSEQRRYDLLFKADARRADGVFSERDMERILRAKKVNTRLYQKYRERVNRERKDKYRKREMKVVVKRSQKRDIPIREE